MTDTKLITAVLESYGWTKTEGFMEYDGAKIPFSYWDHKQHKRMYGDTIPPILTSLDACHEVFEKDAPDAYWEMLFEYCLRVTGHMLSARIMFAKLPARQRCEAWLRFKGVEIK